MYTEKKEGTGDIVCRMPMGAKRSWCYNCITQKYAGYEKMELRFAASVTSLNENRGGLVTRSRSLSPFSTFVNTRG